MVKCMYMRVDRSRDLFSNLKKQASDEIDRIRLQKVWLKIQYVKIYTSYVQLHGATLVIVIPNIEFLLSQLWVHMCVCALAQKFEIHIVNNTKYVHFTTVGKSLLALQNK